MSLTVVNEIESTHPNQTITITFDTFRDVESIGPFVRPEEYYVRMWITTVNGHRKMICRHGFKNYDDAYNAYRALKVQMQKTVEV